jgi:hypothetical protein
VIVICLICSSSTNANEKKPRGFSMVSYRFRYFQVLVNVAQLGCCLSVFFSHWLLPRVSGFNIGAEGRLARRIMFGTH